MAGTVKASVLQHDVSGVAPVIRDGAGTEIGQICKGWGNYSSSPTMNSSFNISSITKVSTGDFYFNFTTSMSSSFYSYTEGGYNTASSDGGWNAIYYGMTVTSSAFRVRTYNIAGSPYDHTYAYFAVFR
jgi:hypothetical protein